MPNKADGSRDFVRGGNVPLYATIALIVMVVAAVALVLVANPATAPSLPLVLGLICTTVPSLVAAIFSERASRDIRNGVVLNKAKEGAKQALAEIHSHSGIPLHSHNAEDNDPVLSEYPHKHTRKDEDNG